MVGRRPFRKSSGPLEYKDQHGYFSRRFVQGRPPGNNWRTVTGKRQQINTQDLYYLLRLNVATTGVKDPRGSVRNRGTTAPVDGPPRAV
jgi:hypothetical protein